MEADKTKSPPFPAELAFGPTPDDVLHLTLDRDIVTENFLLGMDKSARHLFRATIASVRRSLSLQGQIPAPDETNQSQPQSAPANRRQKRAAASKAVKSVKSRKAKVEEPVEFSIDDLEKMLPAEEESYLLAQAEECVYYAETLASVIIRWDMTQGGKPVPITEKKDLPCCQAPGSQCRHASAFLRSRSRSLLTKLFKFCLFEAAEPEKKAGPR